MNLIIWLLDYALVAFSVAIGLFLGLAGLLMAQLIGMGAWVSVAVLLVFAVVMYFGVELIDRVSNWVLPSGINKALPETPKTNAYVKQRNRSGRIGFVMGTVLAMVASLFLPPEQIMEFF